MSPLRRLFTVLPFFAISSGACATACNSPEAPQVKVPVIPSPPDTTTHNVVDTVSGPVTGPARFDVVSHTSVALPGTRSLRVYLPPGYDSTSTRRYPVMYFQPGANAFVGSRSADSSPLSWGIDTTLTTLIHNRQIPPVIVVGIDQLVKGDATEYVPPAQFCYPVSLPGSPPASKGAQYASMVVTEIKPFIDARYRTMAAQQSTAMMGSSSAGWEGFYVVLNNSATFGKLALLSTSTCAGESVSAVLNIGTLAAKVPVRFYLGVAGNEASGTLFRTQNMYNALLGKGWTQGVDVKLDTLPGGTHDEATWSKQVAKAVTFLFN